MAIENPEERQETVPLSVTQQEILLRQDLLGSQIYGVGAITWFDGPLREDLLVQAAREVVEAEPMLRAAVWRTPEGAFLRIRPLVDWTMPVIDLASASKDEAQAERAVQAHLERLQTAGVDPCEPPLWRFVLLRLGPQKHAWIHYYHHILVDFFGAQLVWQRMRERYNLLLQGTAQPLLPGPPPGRLPRRESQYLAGAGRFVRDREFWERRFPAEPGHVAKVPEPVPGLLSRLVQHRWVVSRDRWRRFEALAAHLQVSPAQALTAFVSAYVARACGLGEIVLGMPVHNRLDAADRNTIGLFVKTLPLRVAVAPGTSFATLAQAVSAEIRLALRHQQYPVGWLLTQRESRGGIAGMAFDLLASVERSDLSGHFGSAEHWIVPFRGHPAIAPIAVYLRAYRDDGDVPIDLDIDPRAMPGLAEAQFLVARLDTFLDAVLAHPREGLDVLDLLDTGEREQVLGAFAHGPSTVGNAETVCALFEMQAARTPSAVALEHGLVKLDFAALDARANRLARVLRQHGVGVDRLVALDLERSVDLVVALLAIFKAGGAYLPLDPADPPARRDFVLKDARPQLLLTTSERLSANDGARRTACLALDTVRAPADESPVAPMPSGGGPTGDSLAYVLYTSGSTGRPKGVSMPHRPLCNLLTWQLGQSILPRRTLQFSALSFDVAFQDIFSTLCSGGTLVLADGPIRQDPKALLAALSANRIERLFLPYVSLQQLAGEWRESAKSLPHLRDVITAGERLHVSPSIRAFFEKHPECRLHNQYGPTETHVVTAHVLEGSAETWPETPPIGRPIDNVYIRILDTAGRPVPIGTPGEICVGGLCLARGYLNRPDLTAERFVVDSIGSNATARIYRTGDIGRWQIDGNIDYVGRNDQQLKIRGFRVEPGEIESVLLGDPDIAQAAVVGRVDEQGRARLVAYLAAAAGREAPKADAVRAQLEARLPIHMVPSLFVVLPALPRTSSGKVDRMALPVPPVGSQGVGAMVPPRSSTEQTLWRVWRDLLHTESFGVEDSFYALGGHSLLITQVRSRIISQLGLELPLADLFQHLTIAQLAAHVDEMRRGSAHQARSIVMPRVARDRPLPVSLSQRRMWVIQQLDPHSVAYNVPIALRLRGPLDDATMRRALDYLLERHEGLRTSFVSEGDEPLQVIHPSIDGYFEALDLRGLPADQREEEAIRVLRQRIAVPFDLFRAPLHRLTLVTLAPDDHVLFWLLHHAIVDNWALALLLRELCECYAALAAGRSAPALPALATEYGDYAAWQRSPAAVAARSGQVDYWLRRLAKLPPLNLPLDFPRPREPSFRGGRVIAPLNQDTFRQLRDYCTRHAVTPFVVLLAAFKVVLSRVAQSTDVALGTPIANRHHAASEEIFGTMVNTLVMRTDLGGDPSFEELAQRVQQTAVEAYAHQDVPFDELVEALREQRVEFPPGVVSVLFNVLNAPLGQMAKLPFDVSYFEVGHVAAQFDLSMHVDTEFAHRVHLEYATDLFAPQTAQRFLETYLFVLEQCLADPARRLSEFSLLPPGQLTLLRQQWNATASALPPCSVVHGHVAAGAPSDKERVAVADAAGARVGYGELWSRSRALARVLRSRGIGRGQRVGLCLRRDAHVPAAMLGVLQSGACYVPLDPGYPRERLEYMAADAQLSAILISHGELRGLFDTGCIPVLALDEAGLYQGVPTAPLEPDGQRDARPQDPAYMIYTSGSTGRPKGVLVPHRAVVNFLASMAGTPGLGADDRLLAVTTLSFDIAVLELLLPLSVGAQLTVADTESARDPFALRQLLESSGANVMQATPSTWRLLFDAGWGGDPGLRALIGGEALPLELAERLLATCGQLWNMYGPTETTVWSTCWRVERPRQGISIGRPIANTSVWVLDAHGQPCPIGVAGEVHIGGAGVALGYFERPELTAERFIADPFSEEPGARLYKTGDLGRWRHDGLLEHLGRLDHQVKVRGFRIELGEIEAALLDQPEVKQALVSTWAAGAEDLRLVAYVVASQEMLDAEALREKLHARLPEYMLPQHLVRLAQLPLLPNGKVDRSRLPAPDKNDRLANSARTGRSDERPLTPQEQVIAQVWGELLGVEDIVASDNFFELGGHSLLAMKAIIAIEKRTGRRLQPRRMIFETLAQLAQFDVPDQAQTAGASPPSVDDDDGTRARTAGDLVGAVLRRIAAARR